MTTLADANTGTAGVHYANRFALVTLVASMDLQVDGFDAPLALDQFSGGQTNLTDKVITPGSIYFTRRGPRKKSAAQFLRIAH